MWDKGGWELEQNEKVTDFVYTTPPRHKIDTQLESNFFHRRHFASKWFWFYEFLFVEIWAVTKHSD